MSTSDERLTDLEQQVLALWRAIKGESTAVPDTKVITIPRLEVGVVHEVVLEPAYVPRSRISEASLERYRTAAAQIASEIEARAYD